MKLLDTQMPAMFSQFLHDNLKYTVGATYTEQLADVLFSGAASLLADIKSQDRPAAIVFKTVNGNFVAAGIVQFFENEDKENPGNWSLVWTFNEEDIPENTFTVSISDGQVQPYFQSYALDKYGIQFISGSALENLITYVLVYIKKWLDENAKEEEEVVIEQDGVFEARVAVENGEKVFALAVCGEIKQMIKDDSAIEK